MIKKLNIGTRGSKLALWQANWVKSSISTHHPDLEINLVIIKTKGDIILDVPLAKVGGKGLFVKEIEEALLDSRIDLAVHSMKDMPADIPKGLCIGPIPKREDPRDAFVSNKYKSLAELPEGSVVGTSSLRRQSQLSDGRPDLKIAPLRGNVNTRLRKLDEGEFDAIILASAGLIRLGFEGRITSLIEPEQSLPAIGQGAVGIECRVDDERVNTLLAPLLHADTAVRVRAERAMNHRLMGGCQVPIAGYAILQGDELYLRGLVGEPDGSRIIRAESRGTPQNAESMGVALAEELLANGAGPILKALYDNQ